MKYLYLVTLLLFGLNSFAQTSNPDTLSKHVHYLASEELQGRALGTEGKDKASTYILQQFQEAGLQAFKGSYTQEFDLKFNLAWVKATNIIGVVEGTDPNLKNELIVLGAHYDHLGYTKDKKDFYPGADDNASGVAAIIELAKHFGQHPPKRSIIFIAFDAEESGLLGAKHFVKTLDKSTRHQIKAMFSFDMVGMLSANKGLSLKGIASIANGKEIALKNANGLQLRKLTSAIEARTDTEPFGSIGIPAVHVFTGFKSSPYHKPEDKPDLLDYEGMSKVVDFTAHLVTELANKPQLEATASMQRLQQNPKKTSRPFTIGASGYFGHGKHLYKDEFYDAKDAVSFSIGAQFNYRLTPSFALHLEGLYDQNNSKSAEGTFTRHAILVPLSIEYGKIAFVSAGAYFRHHFDGKNGDTKLDFDNTYRQQEWGYNLGFGLKLSKYRLSLVRRGSFQSIYQSNGPKVIPTAFYANLGYNF